MPAAAGAAKSSQAMTMVGMPTRQIISAHEEIKIFGGWILDEIFS